MEQSRLILYEAEPSVQYQHKRRHVRQGIMMDSLFVVDSQKKLNVCTIFFRTNYTFIAL